MMQRRKCLTQLSAALVCGWGLLASAAVAAESHWPQKPITVVVPFPAGGMTDVLARRLAKDMSDELKQPVVVENRAGASGQIGTDYVSRAAPDGYTLLVSATHHVINPAVRPKLPYDAHTAFQPLALLATTPNLLVVNKEVPVKDIASFSAYAREQPGGLMFGSSSIGGATHLSGEMLKLEAGIPMTHVPYKGASPALTDLLGGQIPALFHDVMTMAPYVRDGSVRALGVTSAQRSPALPDVPTIAEQGVPGYEAITWIGFYGPAGLSPQIAQKLNAVARASVNAEAARPWFKENGTEPGDMNLQQYDEFVKAEMAKWKNVVDRAGVKIE